MSTCTLSTVTALLDLELACGKSDADTEVMHIDLYKSLDLKVIFCVLYWPCTKTT